MPGHPRLRRPARRRRHPDLLPGGVLDRQHRPPAAAGVLRRAAGAAGASRRSTGRAAPVQAGLFNPLITAGFRLLPGVYDFLVGPAAAAAGDRRRRRAADGRQRVRVPAERQRDRGALAQHLTSGGILAGQDLTGGVGRLTTSARVGASAPSAGLTPWKTGARGRVLFPVLVSDCEVLPVPAPLRPAARPEHRLRPRPGPLSEPPPRGRHRPVRARRRRLRQLGRPRARRRRRGGRRPQHARAGPALPVTGRAGLDARHRCLVRAVRRRPGGRGRRGRGLGRRPPARSRLLGAGAVRRAVRLRRRHRHGQRRGQRRRRAGGGPRRPADPLRPARRLQPRWTRPAR